MTAGWRAQCERRKPADAKCFKVRDDLLQQSRDWRRERPIRKSIGAAYLQSRLLWFGPQLERGNYAVVGFARGQNQQAASLLGETHRFFFTQAVAKLAARFPQFE